MAIAVVLKELFPNATADDLTEIVTHYIKVHGPIPVGEDGNPTMTAGQFVQQHLREHLVNIAGSSVHRTQQVNEEVAKKATMDRLRAL